MKAQRPNGSPLDNLFDAVMVSAQLSEQADSLISHFVDQARRSGASWSQIGASISVTKQAAQQRFVPRGPVRHRMLRRLLPSSPWGPAACVAATLAGLGVTKPAVQQQITAAFAALRASRNPSGSGA